MNSVPLHPAIVHIPLGLAMLMPVFAAGFAWAIWTKRLSLPAWLGVVALQGLLVGSALVAINTGSIEEERVEQVVPEPAIHRHEEYAEQFAWASGASLMLSALVLLGQRRSVAGALTAVAVVASVAVAALALRVGHAGGQLVYNYHAASAYQRSSIDTTETSLPLRDESRSRGEARER